MSATKSNQKSDIRAVIDTHIFVPALAGNDPEADFYSAAVRKCWKIVLSEHISNEYQRVIHEYGYRADVVLLELAKLDAMNKYRSSEGNPEAIGEDLAPRKDRHVVAPCREGAANVIVTNDRGIHARKARILSETGAQVMNLDEAKASLERP